MTVGVSGENANFSSESGEVTSPQPDPVEPVAGTGEEAKATQLPSEPVDAKPEDQRNPDGGTLSSGIGTTLPFLAQKITLRPIQDLVPYQRNARKHPKKQIKKLIKGIHRHGFIVPILVLPDGTVLDGHAVLEAAQQIGLKVVPTIVCDHLTEDEARAFRLFVNRVYEDASWDSELLRVELSTLVEHEFAIELTGFDPPEIDLYLHTPGAGNNNAADDIVPETDPEAPVITRPGDLWILDHHRLLCGDATSTDAFAALMRGECAQMVITDAPYNVPIDGHVCGSGAIKHAEFAMASGEMSEEDFIAFLGTVFGHLSAYAVDGSIQFYFIDWRHLHELLTAAHPHFGKPKNLIVWAKTNAGMGTFYRSQHELIPVFKKGTAPHVNNFELGQHGRYRSNLWTYPGINAFGKDRLDELAMHPTVKPVAMIADALLDCSTVGGIILDCFAGSGTILIAAEKTKRRAFAMEIEPKYIDVAIRRWETFTGKAVVHAETGQTFAETAEVRRG